jgi:hypothetical protein
MSGAALSSEMETESSRRLKPVTYHPSRIRLCMAPSTNTIPHLQLANSNRLPYP